MCCPPLFLVGLEDAELGILVTCIALTACENPRLKPLRMTFLKVCLNDLVHR